MPIMIKCGIYLFDGLFRFSKICYDDGKAYKIFNFSSKQKLNIEQFELRGSPDLGMNMILNGPMEPDMYCHYLMLTTLNRDAD